MGGTLAAYLVTVSMVSWRWWRGDALLPPPATIAAAGGVFAACAAVGRGNAALGNALAWGVTLAVSFQAIEQEQHNTKVSDTTGKLGGVQGPKGPGGPQGG